ncbi:MAG: putative oxidoreductase, partial [Pseudonocardiales bacterium]|nr:putative oxidoreductase [Pseudonocardiales bacterium]
QANQCPPQDHHKDRRHDEVRRTRKPAPAGIGRGLGAMGMSPCYGARDETESIATLNRAVDLGATLIDTRRSRRAI